jgi:hypothetical protein
MAYGIHRGLVPYANMANGIRNELMPYPYASHACACGTTRPNGKANEMHIPCIFSTVSIQQQRAAREYAVILMVLMAYQR